MSNPVRTCIGCGQTDDHPRHVIDVGAEHDVTWHNDCHARATGCEHCTEVVNSSGGLQGDELRAHIQEHNPAGNVPAPQPQEG